MEWGIAINLRESVSEIIEKAIIADQGRLDTVWITDYPATRLSPVLASVVAKKTKNCRIGVGLLSPLIYAPSHILQMMKTLIKTHGERFDLLLGPGDRTRLGDIGVSYGDVSTLVKRLRDSVAMIRDGLAKYNDVRILLGAQGPKMIGASSCSDGVLLNYSDSEMIRWAISFLKEKPPGFKIGVFPPALIGNLEECEKHMGIKTSAAVVAMGLSSSIKRKFGLTEELQPAINRLKESGLNNDVVEMIDQKILDRFCLCGNIQYNTSQLAKYHELEVDMVVYGPPQGASINGVRRLVEARSKS